MPTRPLSVREADGRPPTAAELARRREILDATIAVIGRGGWAACTLQAVAAEVGVTKAAVIYHVGTKAALVERAYAFVIEAFTQFVQERVEASTDPLDAVTEFALAHLDYMREHRDHARLIAESLHDAHGSGIDDRPTTPARAEPAIALIEAARTAGNGRARHPEDARAIATVVGGMIDSAVAAWLIDPDFDLEAAKRLIALHIVTTV